MAGLEAAGEKRPDERLVGIETHRVPPSPPVIALEARHPLLSLLELHHVVPVPGIPVRSDRDKIGPVEKAHHDLELAPRPLDDLVQPGVFSVPFELGMKDVLVGEWVGGAGHPAVADDPGRQAEVSVW
ncbi:MAG: hypothetical protein A2W03_14815 [Candidatus Aminicenantes bacterium RBG_16_63_16]|nr:MAG: hypothetical protein A2W03_14815 [Candidatus Aminicenantes bacterium RBG_16_63_16]